MSSDAPTAENKKTMDFFGHQDQARQHTMRLMLLFAAAVLAIIFSIYFVAAIPVSMFTGKFFNGLLFLIVAGAVVAIVGGAALKKKQELSEGGQAVAKSLGATRVNPDSRDPDEHRLINVVEETAIASGVPVPPVYIMDEDGINAFAAGYAAQDAVVAVTRGTMHNLSRDELQGVVAHEFSHILNGDMRMNIRLIAILHGIVILSYLGERMVHAMDEQTDSSAEAGSGGVVAIALVVAGITMTIVGYVGEICARVIQMALSRQREYLADASAVQFTRNPLGIGGALRKIGGMAHGSRVKHANARAMSHMFFADGMHMSFSNLFSTHPDLGDRVRRIDPSWGGEF